MATNPSGRDPAAIPRRRVLSKARLSLAAGLLVLLAVCVFFSWTTRDAMAKLPYLKDFQKGRGAAARQNTVVDLRPWQTARALAALAVTSEEIEYAHEAERLAGHEVDQAFAAALRQANTQRHALTGEALQLSRRVTHFEQLVKDDEARLQSLTQSASRAGSPSRNKAPPVLLKDDLDIAKAQFGLDSDEAADAQQDFARAIGDERTKIQQELAAHEAVMRKYAAETDAKSQVAVVSAQHFGSLARRLQAWFNERSRNQLIEEAIQQEQADATTLIAEHNRLEGEANAVSSATAVNSLQSDGNSAAKQALDKSATLAALNSRAAKRQLLSIYDDRIQTQQQLAAVYGKWSAQVLLQYRIVVHLLLRSFGLIALILLCVVLFDAVVGWLVDRPTLDRRHMHSLRIVFKLAIPVVGALLILLVIFGVPNQMPTIVGLTTAGITVVLQDFILALLGWFVLMGKNGIRVGDWVEVNGIGGEVVETGVFRTVMLETGNWTDKGHPTGRRVSLMNSFAVKGQYFNFSTTGQWMWDEITLTVPPREDAFHVIELIHKAVLEETESDARLAEQEWKRVAKQNRLGQFTVESSIDMRPGVNGLDIIVRYVTRAAERFEVRQRLYQRVIDLLQATGRLLKPEPAALNE